MKKFTIDVTQHDIDTSKQHQPEACMVHDAMARTLDLPAGINIRVNYGMFSIGRKANRKLGIKAGKRLRFNIPQDISDKIMQFDADRSEVQPFAFDVEFPDDWRERLG